MFNTKIIKIQDEGTRLIVEYDVLKDKKRLYSNTINMEGDVIDIQTIKNSMRKELVRLNGVEKKKASILELQDKEYTYDEIKKELVSKTIDILKK